MSGAAEARIVTPDAIQREIVRLSLELRKGLPQQTDDVSTSICLGALTTTVGMVIGQVPEHQRPRFTALHAKLMQMALSQIR